MGRRVARPGGANGVSELYWTGERVTLDDPKQLKLVRSGFRHPKPRLPREERLRGYKADVRFGPSDQPLNELVAAGLTPVAVEIRQEFQSLIHFQHPENAVYVFGSEDSSIPKALSTPAIGSCISRLGTASTWQVPLTLFSMIVGSSASSPAQNPHSPLKTCWHRPTVGPTQCS